MRVESNKSGSTFHDKSGDAILLATPNHWDNILTVRTYILKHNVSNPINLVTRHIDFETLHHFLDISLMRSCIIVVATTNYKD